jgi:hypothetical protein
MSKLHVIYVTGLGDRQITSQQKAVGLWRLWGAETEICQMDWGDKQPWQPKFDKLLGMIDLAAKAGKPVGLVGVSAGASAAVNAYAARKDAVTGLVCLCGKVNRPDTVHSYHNEHNPAFVTSIHDCQKALKSLTHNSRKHIMSRYAFRDSYLSREDSYIAGAKNRIAPTIGHSFSIAVQITLGAPSLLSFLKKQSKR